MALLGGGPAPVVVTPLNDGPGSHQVVVTLPGSSASLSGLRLSQSSPGDLSQVTLQLANGGSQTIWITALQPSVADDDVQLLAFADPVAEAAKRPAGKGNLTNEQVTFEKDVRNADTPPAMEDDRIPPTKPTPTTVTLNVTLTKGQEIVIGVRGDGPDTGTVKFKSATNASAAGVFLTEIDIPAATPERLAAMR